MTQDITASGDTRPLVMVEGLQKSFGELAVLRGVDFEVAPGTVTVRIGPSGSGKTTVLRSLNALERPDAGVVGIGEVSADFAQTRESAIWPRCGRRARWSSRATTSSRT